MTNEVVASTHTNENINDEIDERVLAISHERDSNKVAELLHFVNTKDGSTIRELSLHGIRIDHVVATSFMELLRGTNNEDNDVGEGTRSTSITTTTKRMWDVVEFINCSGNVELAMMIAMTMDCITCFNVIRNVDMVENNNDNNCLGFNAIGIGLQANQNLKSLRITSSVTKSAADALSNGLANTTSLEELDLRWSSFETDTGSITSLASGLKKNKSIKSLKLFGCNIDDPELACLLAALRYHPTLEELNLNGNTCGMSATRPLSAMLSYDKTRISRLDISFQKLPTVIPANSSTPPNKIDIPHLALSLRSNTSLQFLDLKNNQLTDDDARLLAASLTYNETLCEVLLGRNDIGIVGITEIGNQLPYMTGLKRLSLWGNPGITEKGALELLQGLERNVDIIDLELFRTFACSNLIYYYLTLNRGGRKVIWQRQLQQPPMHAVASAPAAKEVTTSNTIPLSLWPAVLERANLLDYSKRSFVTNVTINTNATAEERNRNRERLSQTAQQQNKHDVACAEVIYCLLRNGPVLHER